MNRLGGLPASDSSLQCLQTVRKGRSVGLKCVCVLGGKGCQQRRARACDTAPAQMLGYPSRERQGLQVSMGKWGVLMRNLLGSNALGVP